MTSPTPESADRDHTLSETAAILRVSTRWIRDRIKDGKEGTRPFVEHTRRGNKIMFTPAQLEKLRVADAETPPVVESITTGRRRTR